MMQQNQQEIVIGVVGAGNMGAGIAQKYATEGFLVVVYDESPQGLKLGQSRIENTLDEAVARKLFSLEQTASIKNKLRFSSNIDDLAHSDLIIEAIFEDEETKKALFSRLDSLCDEKTIFATNTSSFYVSRLAQATKRADRFLGLHYFYHPAKNRLVEVIKGRDTSAATFAWAWKLQEQIGKIAIESKDAPGFVVNRYFVPWLNEAMRIKEEGIANIATIESAAKKTFACGMGPFELMNVTGVPITFHAATTLAAEMGTFYQPSALIKPIIDAKSTWDLSGQIEEDKIPKVSERLLSVIFYVAAQLSCEEEVCSIADCDLGARVGLRWDLGPFELMNKYGLTHSAELVQNLCKRYSMSVPQVFTKNLPERFNIEQISTELKGMVATLTFNRPDALNALNEAMIDELSEKFTALEKNPQITGIVLSGRGKAFVAGADTKFFVEQINKGDIDRIVSFASAGQKLFRAIDQSKKTVVCAINGMALGGGMELALACDFIVCSNNAKLAFPETSIGIYPGLGGTQRLPRRCGPEIAKWLILTGEMIDAKSALNLGIVDIVTNSAELLTKAAECALYGTKKTPPPAGAEWDKIKRFFSADESMAANDNQDKLVQRAQQRMQRNAPLAIKMARELISFTLANDLAAGLVQETQGLKNIFSSKDAQLGLSSIGKEKPVFKGL